MDINTLVTAISSVGFPIFACIVMFKQVEELRRTIESNTKVMVRICAILKIEVDEDENEH